MTCLLSFSSVSFIQFCETVGEWLIPATKADLAQKVADDYAFLKGEAAEIVEKILEIMKARCVAGEDVMLSGFGK